MINRLMDQPRLGVAALSLAAGSLATGVAAQPVLDSGAQLVSQLEGLPTGDQLIVADRTENIAFAGRDVALDGFSGVFGYATKIAYILVVDGTAEAGDVSAGRGQMLMIQPLGAKVSMARFDAARLHDALEVNSVEGAPDMMAELADLVGAQKLGFFTGRLSRTNFNVATLGSAEQEIDRRARVGGQAVRSIRFAEPDPAISTERTIVASFVDALAKGDAVAAAEFIDPLPFGMDSLQGRAGEARLVMARQMLNERDWRPFAAAEPTQAGETSWAIAGAGAQATVTLRRTTDFAFVQSVEVE